MGSFFQTLGEPWGAQDKGTDLEWLQVRGAPGARWAGCLRQQAEQPAPEHGPGPQGSPNGFWHLSRHGQWLSWVSLASLRPSFSGSGQATLGVTPLPCHSPLLHSEILRLGEHLCPPHAFPSTSMFNSDSGLAPDGAQRIRGHPRPSRETQSKGLWEPGSPSDSPVAGGLPLAPASWYPTPMSPGCKNS